MKTIHKNSLFNLKRLMGFVVVILYCANHAVLAQYNYIQNPSFEQYDTCPDWIGQIQYAHYWSNLQNHSGGTVDFLNACANPDTMVGIPKNGFGYQVPKTGVGYSLLALFQYSSNNPTTGGREYMTNHLKQALISSKKYCVKAYINLSEASYCGIDGFGFYFDNGSLVYDGLGYPPNVLPQVENISYNIIKDTSNWVSVYGTFVANGTEEYITLGNFKNNLNTHFSPTPNDPGIGYYVAGYYIDDISVIESDLSAFAGNDTALLNPGDSLYLGRPAEIGLECVWYNWTGDSIGTGAGIWVTPQHTAPYIVEQNLCGTIKRDTVYVSVGTSIENASVFEGLKVFPNPSEGQFTLWSKNFQSFSTIAISISEISGKVVYSDIFASQAERVIETKLPSGMYFLQVREIATGKMAVRRLVIR